jgi:hypothetical protein
MGKRYYSKYLILAIVGSAIIGLAFYLLLNNYLDKKEIIVASRNINAGERVSEDDLSFKEYYNNSLPENYLASKEEIAGKIINIERKKDDYISSDMFDKGKDEPGIFDSLSDGDVLMTVNVQYTEPILGELKAGDCISIVSTVYDKDLVYTNYTGFSAIGNTGNNNSISLNQISEQEREGSEDEESNEEINENYVNSEDTSGKNFNIKDINNVDTNSGDMNTGNISGENISNENNYFLMNGDYIDNATLKLSENVTLVNGQIIVRDLEIICIKKDVLSNNQNSFLNNSITSIYLKCNIKEAPFVAKLTKGDDYKIIVEDI